MQLQTNLVKPDKNQPRRTFNAEKMDALEASMKADGFRQHQPLLIDGDNILIDGERRWKTAKKLGIKNVPVIIKSDVSDAERLIYQLQSEGAEMPPYERNKAWVKLFELNGGTKDRESNPSKSQLAKKLGINPSSFSKIIADWYDANELLSKLRVRFGTSQRDPVDQASTKVLASIQRIDGFGDNIKTKLAKKSIDEKWDKNKALTIRKALEEKPLRAEQIASHDYSGDSWELHLEVAKAGFSEKEAKDMQELSEEHDEMSNQIGIYSDIFMLGLKLAAAMRQLKYKDLTQVKLTEYHQRLHKYMPYVNAHINEVENYMISEGLLSKNNKKLAGGK